MRGAGRRRLQSQERDAGARGAAAADARRRPSRQRYFRDTRDLAQSPRHVRPRSIATGSACSWSACASQRDVSRMLPDLGDREDWFTPVDGFVPSLGFGAAVFDHDAFNHAYVAGHLSFKTAADGRRLRARVRAAALRHDEALPRRRAARSDGQRRSVAALVHRSEPRRDRPAQELPRLLPAARRAGHLGASHPSARRAAASPGAASVRRTSRSRATSVSGTTTNRSGRTGPAIDGRLSALVVGASLDGASFDRESLGTTYRRHLLEDAVRRAARRSSDGHSTPVAGLADRLVVGDLRARALGSDFDFQRHILSAAARACRCRRIRTSAPAPSAAGRTACCRRSGSSPSAGSARSTATNSRKQSANTLALREPRIRARLAQCVSRSSGSSTPVTRSSRNVVVIPELCAAATQLAEGVGFGIARRRRARRFRLQARRRPQLAAGHSASWPDVLVVCPR